MSLLAMDTSSLFDPFEFPSEIDIEPPKPQPKFREKLEIKTLRHQDHHLKDMMVPRDSDSRSRDFIEAKSRQHDVQPKVHMLDSPSPTTAPGVSDVQSARQKLRDSLASALDMVVSKQLVKSVLGVGEDVAVDCVEEVGAGQNASTLEVSHSASLTQENQCPKDGQTVDSLVVDLGPLETETMNIDSIGGEVSVPEFVANVGDYRLTFEQGEYGEDAHVVESPFKKLKTGFGHLDYVHRKLEIEEKEGRIAVEDVNGGIHIVDQARKLATDIEAELFKLCGSKKTYNQKARSLLFNLKDKSNPELRARVFSGEIPPADLCRMTGEQLASKELSDWRNAKEQALDKMLVLTDADTVSGKVVKKTHKGEFIVDVQNESTVDIVPVVTRSVFPVDKVEKVQQEASEQLEAEVNHSPNKSKYGGPPSQKRSRSDEIDRVGVSFSHSSPPVEEPNSMEMTTTPELTEPETVLPTIMSLDEYMEAQEEEAGVQEDVFEDAPIEPRGSATPSLGSEMQEASDKIDPPSTVAKAFVKEDTIRKHDESPKVKPVEAPPVVHKQKSFKSDKAGVAWTGHIQLSGNRQSPLVVRHRSGENVDLKNWPKSLELKGRVRLAHLDKFLQELQQSRSRAVTVVSILVQDGHADQASATDHVKEVANQYQMGERVGFVEPRSGYELYLLPPGNGTTKLLSEHGHPEVSPEALGKDVVLVGVIVWRRSHLSSSSSRLPDRNKNVKRHAVASSAHHHESKSSHRGAGMGSSSKDQPSEQQARSSRPTQRGSSTTATTTTATTSNNNVNSTAAAVAATASSMHHHLKFPVESSPTREPSSSTRNWQPPVTPTPPSNAQQVLKSHHILPAPSDATTDMPPGFSLRPAPASRLHLDPRPPPADIPPGFWPRPAAAAAAAAEEDDDLPEFDFSVHAVAGPPPRSPPGQFNALEPPLSISHLSQFPRQSPSRVAPSEQGGALPPPPSEFSQYPPRPPGPPPPPQDPAAFRPNYYPSAAPISHENDQFRQSEPLRVGIVQYGNGAVAPLRNDLPEWRPSAQFQLRPAYENQQHLHFDSAAAVGGALPPQLPVQQQQQQDMTWPQQQAVPPPLLPPPPPPPQWQAHFQPQWQQQHSNHFQAQQQHMAPPPVRPVDPRAGPFNSWESAPAGAPAAPPLWDAAGARNNSNNSNEHHRANGDHRLKDPRSNEQQFSWHDSRDKNNNNNRETNGGRPDFRRR